MTTPRSVLIPSPDAFPLGKPLQRGVLSVLRRPGFGRLPLPPALAAAAAVAAASLSGCASDPAPGSPVGLTADPAAHVLEPLDSSVAVCPGQSVVIPVALRGPIPSGGTVPVRFGDLPPVRGTLVWIGVSTEPGGGANGGGGGGPLYAATWMGSPGQWSVTPASRASRPHSTGTWAIVADVPAAVTQSPQRTLRIADRPFPLTVLPAGCRGVGDLPRLPAPAHFSPGLLATMRGSPWLLRTLDAHARSPLARWRARLARDLIASAAGEPEAPLPSAVAFDGFADPVLETWAAQLERRWAAGLARLAEADAFLAAEVAWRIAAVADFGGGVAMPVWPSDTPALRTLGDDLINPLLTSGEIAFRARAWLDAQPQGVLWVLDDGGASDALTGALISTVGVLNLGAEPAVSWAAHERSPRAGEMSAVAPRSTSRATAVAPVAPASPAAPVSPLAASTILEARIGDLAARRFVIARPIPVSPPGLRIGPLQPDWSLAAWLASGAALDETTSGAAMAADAARLDESWITAAMLHRAQPRPAPRADGAWGEPPSPSPSEGWILYIECRRPTTTPAEAAEAPAPPPAAGPEERIPGLGQVRRPPPSPAQTGPDPSARGPLAAGSLSEPDEELRIWLGPTAAPHAVLRVTPRGLMIDDAAAGEPGLGGAALRAGAVRIPVRVEPGRWSCWVPIPERAVEPGGLLRIAVERVDARGVRTAWPRPMLPWQREPGRAALDLSGWAVAPGGE